MKRLLTTLLCIALSAMALAQNVVGTWRQTVDEPEASVNETMTLFADGKMTDATNLVLKIEGDDGKTRTLTLSISFSGTWAVANNVISGNYDANSLKVDLPGLPEAVPKLLVNMIKKQAISEFKKEAKKGYRNQIVSLTADKMVLKDADDKKAKEENYTRVK